ncbi:MAG: hypothetical protein K6F17_07885, partial [Lachnospiraceae bacterium]|nr:hypothetical protein [Lachnospiraceae bacterium]
LSEIITSLDVEKQHEIVGTDIVPECIDDSLFKVNSRADDSIKFNDEGGSVFSNFFYSLKENKKEVMIVGAIVAIISGGFLTHKYIKKRKSKEEKCFRIALNKYIEAIKGDNLETEIIDELLESIIALRKRKKSKNISIQLSLDELEIILKNKYHDITAAEMTKVNENDNTNNNVILSFEKYLKIQREILDKSA